MYIYMTKMIQRICTRQHAWDTFTEIGFYLHSGAGGYQVARNKDLIALSPILKNCCYHDI